MMVKVSDSGLKQIESVLLVVAMALIPLGFTTLQGAVNPFEVQVFLAGIAMVLIGMGCAVVYIYIEKMDPTPPALNGDVEAAIDDTENESCVDLSYQKKHHPPKKEGMG